MSLIGPSESGRSALIEATIETTNKLNNTRVQQKTIDCSQYVHENCIAHFVGIEPFYRNPKQGMLTSFVEQNPYSIIVFKNLNMAHPNLQCLVQGLLENGYLEDITTERIVSFEHTQIIISLESDMVTQTTNTNLELSGADLLLEKDLGLESSLGALLTSYTVLKTERLKGQDSYALCQRMFQRLLTHEENLHVEYPRYMSALLFIACGKNTLPSAMESTISDIFEQIKTLNYDYIIDHDLFEQPRIEVKDEILPRQIAMVGMYHDLLDLTERSQ
jgi:hypothetical protein